MNKSRCKEGQLSQDDTAKKSQRQDRSSNFRPVFFLRYYAHIHWGYVYILNIPNFLIALFP